MTTTNNTSYWVFDWAHCIGTDMDTDMDLSMHVYMDLGMDLDVNVDITHILKIQFGRN